MHVLVLRLEMIEFGHAGVGERQACWTSEAIYIYIYIYNYFLFSGCATLSGLPGSLLRRFERFLMPSYHKFCEVLRFSWSSSLGMLGAHFNRCCVLNNFRKHNHYVQAVLGAEKKAERNITPTTRSEVPLK